VSGSEMRGLEGGGRNTPISIAVLRELADNNLPIDML